jgi:transcription initiation factor TFIID subunit 6
LPNLKLYDEGMLGAAMNDEPKKSDAQHVLATILKCLDDMEQSRGAMRANGVGNLEDQRERLSDRVGKTVADHIITSGRIGVAQVILEADLTIA